MKKHPLTVGIEEEYMLVDPDSRDLVDDPPDGLLRDCKTIVSKQVGAVVPEFLRAQVEVGTAVCESIDVARDKLKQLRLCVAEAAERHGLRPIAASTHPFANWQTQRHTEAERYDMLAEDLQAVAQRLLICGMHVHVGLDDDETRIDLMNQVVYFLPHLLALSSSSPFWQARNTGLMSYRISVFDELPRTGLPEKFDSFGEYLRHVEVLKKAGIIDDPSKLWWDIRVHPKFPTLEMRITDVCTRLEDGISIAALYLSLLAALLRLRRNNQRWRVYSNMLINENRWRAQRYGLSDGLIDFGIGEVVPYADLLEEMISIVREDAAENGCLDCVEHARDIVSRGTSAQRQVAIYQAAIKDGASERDALNAVVDWLIDETVTDL